MEIKQWEDKNLAQFSYGIFSNCEKKIILIDPARNPRQYLDYAKEMEAEITGIIETHPHADFVSSHLELHQITGATIYASRLVNPAYPHQTFDEGQFIQLGKIKLLAFNTPGHSPDSISILLEHDGKQKAVFTGDTLFIGDCGRPDLREDGGDAKTVANKLARQMYHSLRNKLIVLQDDAIVYPTHGAGTLCGKALSEASSSTIGEEKKTNWSLQQQTEEEFVSKLLNEQPFVPAYFPFDIELNKKGALPFKESIEKVKAGAAINAEKLKQINKQNLWMIDVRDQSAYKEGHLPGSINLMEGEKFDTWLGSIIQPHERFYLVAKDTDQLQDVIERAAAIGYESQIVEAFVLEAASETSDAINISKFKGHEDAYTIIDVRNTNEVKEQKVFEKSINIPLADLRDKISEIPTNKPVVVHCASGYRSAAGSSLIESKLDGRVNVFDLGEAVKEYIKE
ncbi:MBL fold metallo-hydrolase [Segetibacter koreensis]|uniref:MBL fold metallo-hydrolase n=1 Tax=Segetibacter koreensis TaxID=398037 RepID=UPI00037ADFC3|nr:MBL fold metallo-hydrolase [Segetibacter koreensis]